MDRPGAEVGDDGLRNKLLVVTLCDLTIVLTNALNTYAEIGFSIIYIHLFMVFREIFRNSNKKSNLIMIYEAFIKQTHTYIKSKFG